MTTSELPATASVKAPPEGCILTACWGGDAWSLEVLDPVTNECAALLAWPESWPKTMTSEALAKIGFEIV